MFVYIVAILEIVYRDAKKTTQHDKMYNQYDPRLSSMKIEFKL